MTSLLLVTWATSNICDFSPPTFFEFIPPNTRVGRDQSERSTSYVPGMNGSFLHSATWTLSEGAISSCEREIRVATSVTFDANLDHIAGDEHAGQSVRVYRRNEFSVTSHTILASSTPFWNETLHDHVLWICDARRDDKRPSSIITVAVAPSWATWMLDWVFGHIGRAACLFFFSCAVHCWFVVVRCMDPHGDTSWKEQAFGLDWILWRQQSGGNSGDTWTAWVRARLQAVGLADPINYGQ